MTDTVRAEGWSLQGALDGGIGAGMAIAAIRRGQVHDHMEWMVRTCVIALALVALRLRGIG